ncbi:MAG: hypothetical protein MUF52_07775 [Syntrophobacteraceae bacterium]|nr:hypothetical protein [Syntrophobacteraceae bacterium]
MEYRHALEVALPPRQIFPFFHDLERWFRLNPQWNVRSFRWDGLLEAGATFELEVEYDRSEARVIHGGTVEEVITGRSLTVVLTGAEPRTITIEVVPAGDLSFLKYREVRDSSPSVHEQRELSLWLSAVANYVLVSSRASLKSRLWKWFIDRVWLSMSPSGRRTVFFVVVAEGLSLVFFLLILLWLLVFKRL